jgi:hypothetical protein
MLCLVQAGRSPFTVGYHVATDTQERTVNTTTDACTSGVRARLDELKSVLTDKGFTVDLDEKR